MLLAEALVYFTFPVLARVVTYAIAITIQSVRLSVCHTGGSRLKRFGIVKYVVHHTIGKKCF